MLALNDSQRIPRLQRTRDGGAGAVRAHRLFGCTNTLAAPSRVARAWIAAIWSRSVCTLSEPAIRPPMWLTRMTPAQVSAIGGSVHGYGRP